MSFDGASAWSALSRVHGAVEGADPPDPTRNFREFVRVLSRRVEDKWDNVAVITGEPGVGKSSLGLQIAVAVEPGFDVVKQTAFSSDDIFRLYAELSAGQVLLYDEAVLGFVSSGGARSEETVRLIQALSIVRAKGITAICCIPDMWILDTYVRTGRAKYWIHVYERGRGKVHKAWVGAKYRRPSKLPYDSWDDVTPLGFRKIDRTPIWRTYSAHKMRSIQDWLVARRQDPSGKIKTCPACGLRGSSWNISIHRCPGPKAPNPPLEAPPSA